MLKVSVSGIRGIWGESLNHEKIIEYTKAFVKIIGENSKIILGCDTRKTRDIIKSLVVSVLESYGCEVLDLEIVPTPLVLYGVKKLNADGGIMISASHNPSCWNALKLIKKGGFFFNQQDVDLLKKTIKEKNYLKFNHENLGSIKVYTNLLKDYIQDAKGLIDFSLIRSKNFKVIADVVNGTAIKFIPTLFKLLDLKFEILFDDINKEFEREAEPLPNHLTVLSEKVKSNNANLGLAYDPDADRLALVDELGNAVGEDWTLALAYLNVLDKEKSDIVVNLSTSMIIDRIAKSNSKQVYRAKVGEINVTEKMLELESVIGGEGNGGVIYPKINFCRDSIIATLMVLEYLARHDKTLSSVVKQYPKYFFLKEKIQIGDDLSFDNIKAVIEKTLKELDLRLESVNLEDGIRIEYSGGWIQVRASNTEPVIRIMGENKDEKINHTLLEALKNG